ncbi:MAG: amino acid dehydrogenase [Chloroflexota bacterium]
MSVWEHEEFRGHERVTFFRDEATGLVTINAMHRLINGRCGGGIRFYSYASSDAALTDVLRLSRAMTYKSVLAGIAFGGGKSVIIGDPAVDKTKPLLHAMGRFIDSFQGEYVAGPDVGTTAEDMATIFETTPYVAGHRDGNTSLPTAYGVFRGLQAAVKFKLGRDDLSGLTVAVQGVGGVGAQLCRHLHEAEARLIVADVDEVAVAHIVAETGATAVAPDEILFVECDALAPCALGGILHEGTIGKLKTAVICGGANNQLAEPRHGDLLKECDILFAPDYVVNSGGLIHGVTEVGMLTPEQYEAKLDGIFETALHIFTLADEQDLSPEQAAEAVAEEKLATM